MKKIIKRKLHISTYSRDFLDYINHEFYSHDKHNAFFEFTMEQLPTDTVVALFYFQKTKRYAEIHGVVEDNKVTIEFDTSLITTNETVCGYIYFEKVEQSADVCRFCFNVKVSEIDKLKNAPVVEKETRRLIPMSEIVTKTELQELFKTIERNGGTDNDTEIRKSISSIDERVKTLEAKPDNSTGHVDDDVINRLNALEKNASSYLTEHQPLTSIEESIRQIAKRFNNLSNIYLTSHQSLEHLATNDALNKIEQRVQTLESKPEINISNFATKKELEELRNNQPTVDTSNFATTDKVEVVEERVQTLENKPIVDTSEFAKKTDIPQAYDDSEVKRRLTELEAKPDIDVSIYAKKSEVATAESITNLTQKFGEHDNKIQILETKAGYEIHGTGMPNGKVEAPIGTTYVDTEVTNGALKWIKQSGTGNIGWKVVDGDTGWLTVFEKKFSDDATRRLRIRRINNMVNVLFEGNSYGMPFIKIFYDNNDNIKLMANGTITDGFKPASTISVPAHIEKNDNEGFYGAGALLFDIQNNTFEINLFTSYALYNNITNGLANINFNYVTYEPWPTQLPTIQ